MYYTFMNLSDLSSKLWLGNGFITLKFSLLLIVGSLLELSSNNVTSRYLSGLTILPGSNIELQTTLISLSPCIARSMSVFGLKLATVIG